MVYLLSRTKGTLGKFLGACPDTFTEDLIVVMRNSFLIPELLLDGHILIDISRI